MARNSLFFLLGGVLASCWWAAAFYGRETNGGLWALSALLTFLLVVGYLYLVASDWNK